MSDPDSSREKRRSSQERMLQGFVDSMHDKWQRERAESDQMTLGELITSLFQLDPDRKVTGFGRPHSYRGYYCDLAFEPSGRILTAEEMIENLHATCMGREFTGYKGGDFLMGENTPVWVAQIGSTGRKIVGLHTEDDVVTPETREPDLVV